MTHPGDDLRDAVGRLLRAAKYDVDVEVLVGSKKVDVLYSFRRLGKTTKIAIECKDYDRPLTRDEVSRIYHDLSGLYDARHVDEIHIVTRLGISPAAFPYISEVRCLRHYTFVELQESIMDFTPYLTNLRASFQEDAIDKYFIPPMTGQGDDLGVLIQSWLQSTDSKPIAILAGYGMGKTTFARYLAAEMASQALLGRHGRIPVYIPLGEISSEQSLEGLLGKILTGRPVVVQNYSFDLFMALNSAGRICIFLDGFDEMKHTMSWDEFKFNFSQINRIVVENSRVVLLGRPNAFLSDMEHNWALRGVRQLGSQSLRLADWPEYRELDLAPFSTEGSFQFLEKYLQYRPNKTNEPSRTFEEVKNEIASIHYSQIQEILSRPVHVKMLAEVAAHPTVNFREFTVHQLYDVFIQLTIERELEKQERRTYGYNDRRAFARELAWWLWSSSQGMNIAAGQIPDSLVTKFRKDPNEDIDAVRRDLVSACFLDRKVGGGLYFPHRSFQEFLVSEWLANANPASLNFTEVGRALNPEIVRFLREGGGVKLAARWRASFLRFRGATSVKLIEFLSTSDVANERLDSMKVPWSVALRVFRILRGGTSPNPREEAGKFLLEVAQRFDRIEFRQMGVLCSLIGWPSPERTPHAVGLNGSDMMDVAVCALLLNSFDFVPSLLSDRTGNAFLDHNENNPFLTIFGRRVEVAPASMRSRDLI